MKLYVRATLLLVVAIFCTSMLTGTAHAAFDQNRIIDDAVFNSSSSMSASDIDAFLNANNSCISPNSGFRAIDPTGYSPSTGYQYGGNVTAGTVIAHAAQAYDLNPRVLLVTLQKEQSLITTTPNSTNCSTRTISKSMGYACTDNVTAHSYTGLNLYTRNGTTYTAVDVTCVEAAQKAGFTQQIIRAAWLLKFAQQRSLGNMNWAVIRGSWDNSDDLQSCYSGPVTQGYRQVCPSGPTTFYDGYITIDGTSVHPNSGATAALYYYTPHFAGNENFFTIWTNWFGASIVQFDALQAPRYMQISTNNVYEQDLASGQNVGSAMPTGTQLLFTTKLTLNGVTYLRTAQDTANNLFQGIPQNEVQDIPYSTMLYPRWMKLTATARKQIPRQGKNIDASIPADTSIYFTSKMIVDGTTYLRTSHDTGSDADKGVPLNFLTDVSYDPLMIPRYMQISKPLYKTVPESGANSGSQLLTGTQFKFDTKITLGDNTYLRDSNDTASDTDVGINVNSLLENTFVKMATPRTMKLNTNTSKFDTRNLNGINSQLTINQQITFKSKIFVNGQWYLRSTADTNANVPYGVPLSDLSEVY